MSHKNQIALIVLLVLLVLLLMLAIYFYCFRYKNQNNINALLQDKKELTSANKRLEQSYNKLLEKYKSLILAYISEKRAALEKAGELNDMIIITLIEAMSERLQKIHDDEGIEHDPEYVITEVSNWLVWMQGGAVQLLDRSMQAVENNERFLSKEFAEQLSLSRVSNTVKEEIKSSKSKRGLSNSCACFCSQSEPEPEPEPQPQPQVQGVQVDHGNQQDNQGVD